MVKRLKSIKNTVNKCMADIRPDRFTACQSERKSVVSRRPSVVSLNLRVNVSMRWFILRSISIKIALDDGIDESWLARELGGIGRCVIEVLFRHILEVIEENHDTLSLDSGVQAEIRNDNLPITTPEHYYPGSLSGISFRISPYPSPWYISNVYEVSLVKEFESHEN
jgi:hypothetical protein